MAKRGVSIVVPVQNAEHWIAPCFANLTDVLNRSDDDSEVLLIENGSSDRTLELIRGESMRDARFRVLESEPGIVPALNLGLQSARHAWVMRHDADDLSRPDRIPKFFAFLEARPGVEFSVVCSHSVIANAQDQILGRMKVGPGTGFVHGSAFLKRQHVLEVGGYSTRLPHAEDQDLWERLALRPGFQIGFISEYLYWFRSHGRSVSSRQLQQQLSAFDREGGGIWTPRVRSAIARLAWDKNRWEALKIALCNAHFRKPQAQDLGVPLRILAGGTLDRYRARAVWRDDPGIADFKALPTRYVRAL